MFAKLAALHAVLPYFKYDQQMETSGDDESDDPLDDGDKDLGHTDKTPWGRKRLAGQGEELGVSAHSPSGSASWKTVSNILTKA